MVRNGALRCRLCGAEVDPVRHLRWVRDGFQILRCPACRLLFRSDPPRPRELPELYGQAYFRAAETDGPGHGEGYPDYLEDEELHRRNARRRLDLLGRYVHPGRLLDVGCAAGFFAHEARRRGWAPAGVELSPSMSAYARDRLGLEVVEASFARAEVSGPPFDAVTMWDYVEHSIDPVTDLRRAYSLLRPGGVLALSTGDAGSLVARVSGSRWHLLTPRHHNFFFDRQTLGRALTDAGFEIQFEGTVAARYSIHYLAHKLQTMGTPLAERMTRRLEGTVLGSVALPVDLFDIVTVVAQRPAVSVPGGGATPT
jgi:SAM-dependent methyltransferase